MDPGDNPYKLLGVDPKADYDTIKKAYRKLAIKMHPDKGGDPRAFAKVAHANEVVSDPKQRHNFDLQQQKSNRGWDPQAPEFTTTSDDYDPTKNPIPASPKKTTRTTTTSTQSRPSQTYTTYEYPQKFTTSRPKTTTKTYTTTTSSSSPMKQPTSSRTTTTKSFTSPASPTKTKRTTTNSQSFSSPMSSVNKGMGNMSLSGDDDDIKGMSSSTKTVTHPNGQKEQITETIITKFDGTKEVRRESKMLGGPTKTTTSSSKPMQTMRSPMSTKPKVVTQLSSPKKTKMTNTTSSSSKPSGTSTTTSVKKSPTKTITHSTTTTSSVPKKSPTKKAPRKATLPSGGTTAKVFRNGKLISTTTMG
eukprot:Nitzschia sp. Nitz4//scaffold18_size181773//150430//151509//NITZ4_001937-RA/size181773-processed-gene-0.27-mRNA-1//1//CDS//3329540077//3214//frame0